MLKPNVFFFFFWISCIQTASWIYDNTCAKDFHRLDDMTENSNSEDQERRGKEQRKEEEEEEERGREGR